MDDTRFDLVARSVAAGATRRGALGLLFALGIGGLGGHWDDVEAKKKKKKKKNKRKKKDPCIESHDGTCHSCAPQDHYCPIDKQCCSWERREICSSCGCCHETMKTCCYESATHKSCCESLDGCCGGDCCHPGTKCCIVGERYFCIPENECCDCAGKGPCCGGACCNDPGGTCCKTTGPEPFDYCCAAGLTCKPSGGPTCVAA